jgi:hypothetical protein
VSLYKRDKKAEGVYMVFPSLSFSVDAGIISQMSTLAVIGFSIFLNYWKKTVVYVFVALTLVITFGAFSSNVFAAFYVPGGCGTQCMSNQSYYGTPMTYNRPAYLLPQLQYHSFWGPTPSYFRAHEASPYAPNWYYNCPHCNQQFQSPGFQQNPGFQQSPGWNMLMPNYQHHGVSGAAAS